MHRKIIEEVQLDFSDVLIRPVPTGLGSRREPILETSYKTAPFRPVEKTYWEGIPILAANMTSVGTISAAKVLNKNKMGCAIHKHYSAEQLIEFFSSEDSVRSFYTMGIGSEDFDKFEKVYQATDGKINKICIDVANGYMMRLLDAIEEIKNRYNVVIMAGNVVTEAGVRQLASAGAEIIKIGIGSGSQCLTRRVAGVGRPQLSTILECEDVARELNVQICSDGGCVHPSDVSKALGAGAHFVMLGGMFAGHDECEQAPVYNSQGNLEYPVYGMSSDHAINTFNSHQDSSYRTSEGRFLHIEGRGTIQNSIDQVLGGLRSTCTYVDAFKIDDLYDRVSFYRVNRQLNTKFEE